MSRDVGTTLPDDLLQVLQQPDAPEQRGRVVLLTTSDPEGWPHFALLSYREVGANTSGGIRIVTYAGSQTTANMRASGRVTLAFVDERMAYYVKGESTEVSSAGEGSQVTMDVAVRRVLRDEVGADEAASYITSGIRYRG